MSNPIFTSRLAPHTKVTEEQLATEEGLLAFGENLRALNRRRFLTNIAAAGAVLAAVGASSSPAQAQSSTPSVVDVLNFALNFEYLEGEFYSYAGYGYSLAVGYTTTTSQKAVYSNYPPVLPTNNTTNNPNVTLTGNQLNVVKALAQDESNHITVLQQAILAAGGTPINEVSIDYSAGGKIPPITSNLALFAAARAFTALGNSAYAGAAAYLAGNPGVLQLAAQILGAEAQHLGVVNYLCVTLGITPATDPMIDAQDVPPNGTANIFTITPIPSTITASSAPAAVGISRTPQQVLGVAYGISTPTTTTPPTGVVKGGFFPNGVGGTIVST